MKKIIILMIALILVSFAYAECDKQNTPKIIPPYEFELGLNQSFHVNITDQLENSTFSFAPLNFGLNDFSLNSNGNLFIKTHGVSEHTFLVIATNVQGCYDFKEYMIKVVDKPVIKDYFPEKNIIITEGQETLFSINVTSSKKLFYAWYLDGDKVDIGTTKYKLNTNFSDEGLHIVKVVVSDLESIIEFKWSVTISDYNRPPIFNELLPNFIITGVSDGRLFNLNSYVQDPDDDNLSFRTEFINDIENVVESSLFDTSFDTEGNLFVLPKDIDTSIEYLRIAATDGQYNVFSNTFGIRLATEEEIENLEFSENITQDCEPDIVCDDYSECLVQNYSFRECRDVNNCDNETEIIVQYKECEYGASCFDNKQNQNESGIDCGGPCISCPSCFDKIRNQNETGIDCGGPCRECSNCEDLILNQGETDIDCGGPCEPCIDGQICRQHADCTSLVCSSQICQSPTCSDFRQNNGETGIDCGGSCEPCPSCKDGIKNNGETAIDCGGPCDACESCSDGVKNQDEVFTDCGGTCSCAWFDFITNNKFTLIGIFVGTITIILLLKITSGHKKKYYVLMAKLFKFLPNKLVNLNKNTVDAVSGLKRLQYNMPSKDAIHQQFFGVVESYYLAILETDKILTIKKELGRKVFNPFLKKLLYKLYVDSKKDISNSSLYKIEYNDKIETSIHLLNEIKDLAS